MIQNRHAEPLPEMVVPESSADEQAVESEEAGDEITADESSETEAAESAEATESAEASENVTQDMKGSEGAGQRDNAKAAKGKAEKPVWTDAGSAVSFFFDDADIYEVVHTVFGEVLKVNYLIDPAVTGRVNFRTIRPIPLAEVLKVMEIILRINGVGYVIESGLYRIVPLNKISSEIVFSQMEKLPGDVAIELFTFQNINIKETLSDIQSALGLTAKGALVIPQYSLNAVIVVVPSKEQMELVRQWIQMLDGMFADAKQRIYVYPLQNSKSDHVASLLQSIFSGGTSSAAPKSPVPSTSAPGLSSLSSGMSGQSRSSDANRSKSSKGSGNALTAASSSQPSLGGLQQSGGGGGLISFGAVGGSGMLVSPDTRIMADEITNSIVILSTPGDYSIIEETIAKLDVVPRQVLIEVLVAEATLTNELKFGIEWFIKSHFKAGDTALDGNIRFDSANLDQSLPGFSFTALDSAEVVRGLLQSLASKSKLKVLASPHIIASDNREARIQVGAQVPIVTSEISSSIQTEGSTGIQRNIQYKDTGVILSVIPQINEGGLVTLDISQEVSDVRDAITSGVQSPVIFKRETATNIVVQNGQTVVIGGLIQDRNDKVKEGVPFLSDIPLLGYLFGYTKDTDERTELVVLITPHVSNNISDSERISSEYMDRLKGLGDVRKRQ